MVYSLALPVPMLQWHVVLEMPASVMDAKLRAQGLDDLRHRCPDQCWCGAGYRFAVVGHSGARAAGGSPAFLKRCTK